jgi:hypothetical protein
MEFVDFMLGLVPAHEQSAAINDFDTYGMTPLHCLLCNPVNSSSFDKIYSSVEHLIERGASLDVVDAAVELITMKNYAY